MLVNCIVSYVYWLQIYLASTNFILEKICTLFLSAVLKFTARPSIYNCPLYRLHVEDGNVCLEFVAFAIVHLS